MLGSDEFTCCVEILGADEDLSPASEAASTLGRKACCPVGAPNFVRAQERADDVGLALTPNDRHPYDIRHTPSLARVGHRLRSGDGALEHQPDHLSCKSLRRRLGRPCLVSLQHAFGIDTFGVNLFVASRAGQTLVAEHDESMSGRRRMGGSARAGSAVPDPPCPG